jgi:DNA-binding HxlR family transcriptional regulator
VSIGAINARDVDSDRQQRRAGFGEGQHHMRKTKYNAYSANCPTRQALDRLADKWTVLVVGLLEQRPHRFGELLYGIDGISQKMLTQTLRSLELDGLVNRRVKATVPLDAIRCWAERHIEGVLASRSRQAVGQRTPGRREGVLAVTAPRRVRSPACAAHSQLRLGGCRPL